MKKFFLFLFLFVLSGCTSTTKLLLSEKIPPPTNPEKIRVFMRDPPFHARPIAQIAVARHGENALYAMEALKIEASEIGADAIAQVRISYSSGFLWPSLKVEGIAVRYEE